MDQNRREIDSAITGEILALRVLNQKLFEVVLGVAGTLTEDKSRARLLRSQLQADVDRYGYDGSDADEVRDRAKNAIAKFMTTFID